MGKYLFTILLNIFITSNTYASDRETTVCGNFQEPFLFWLWSSLAPGPDHDRVKGVPFIVPTEFKTSDDKIIRGYKYIANNGDKPTSAKGYILMAMGNAMVSDQIIKELREFSLKGYDVYVYDYRGYANSEGKRRIKAIIYDHKEIAEELNELYDRKLLYGTSLGGAIILNIIGMGVEYDRAVIDSAPSYLSPYGCPKWIDPLSNLPKDSSKLLVITGKQDRILSQSMVSPLREAAQIKGASTINSQEYAHPFNDWDRELHKKRMRSILDYLDHP